MMNNGMLTLYRMATEADLEALKQSGKLTVEVAYPTIIAARKGKDISEALAWTDEEGIIGFLGTHNRNDTVMAGPFEAMSPFIARNLIELYENCLRKAGLTMYWFHVVPGGWQEIVARSERVRKVDVQDDGSAIFRREL